ncbi:hypothetical protein EJB05_36475, partial [Eragrostis curvula]
MLQELAPCACGMRCGGRCGGVAGSSAFSLLFPMAGGGQFGYGDEEGGSPYGGGMVDCTLSLGTPSTRRAEAGAHARGRQDGGAAAVAASCNNSKESGRGSPRRCANCDTASTPLWRNGPRGPKSLCNACGIRYKKEERRAAAAVAPAPSPQLDASGLGSYACGAYVRQHHHQHQHQQPHQWGCYSPAAAAKSASFSMYGGGVDAAAADGPCLSWMLNVMPSSSPAFAVRERATLFHYY